MLHIYSSIALFLIISSSMIFGNSLGQTEEPEKQQISTFVQTHVYDSEGRLVLYLESFDIIVRDPVLLDRFLASQKVVQTKKLDDKDIELFKIITKQEIQHFSSIANTALGITGELNQPIIVAYTKHDAFPVSTGDTVTSEWTILRSTK
jgi:hypothetical protein